MLRVSLLSLSILVITGCAMNAPARGTTPSPAQRVALANPFSFPEREALERVAAEPTPQDLAPEPIVPFETWTVEHTRPAMSQAAPAGEYPFAREVTKTLAKHGKKIMVSDALTCVSQEAARVYALTGKAPSVALYRFIAGRCGSSYRSWSRVLAYDSNYTPERARADVAGLIPQMITLLLRSSPSAIGVGYVHIGRRVVALVSVGMTRVELSPVNMEANQEGVVVVEGKITFDADVVRALINRGPRGVVPCTRDEASTAPNFRFSCTLAKADSSAWIQLSAQANERHFSNIFLEVLAVKPVDSVNTVTTPEQAGEEHATSVEAFEQQALLAINTIRRQAGLSELTPLPEQAASVRKMAPHFFHAYDVSHDEEQVDTIIQGLRAGWDVDQVIRSAGFVSAYLGTRDVNAWVHHVFERPESRWTLLDPQAQAIAIGPTISEDQNAGGALAFVYSFFGHIDHKGDAAQFAARIDQVRVTAGFQPLTRDARLEQALSRAARAVLQNGAAPDAALKEAQLEVLRTTGRAVHGFFIFTNTPQIQPLPQLLLKARVHTFAVSSTHYQPVGSHWGVQVILILCEEYPGGET